MKYFSPVHFIASLALGLFFVYITAPPPNIIVVYPNPHNYNQYQYQDNASNCFVIKQHETSCHQKSDNIFEVPIQ